MKALPEWAKGLRPGGRPLPGLGLDPSVVSEAASGRGPSTGSGFSALIVDQRGATLVTYVLILPLFILLIFGSYAVWRIMVVQQSLALGTYTAARELSYRGRALPLDEYEWWGIADPIVRTEVEGNHLIESGYDLDVNIVLPSTNGCGRSLRIDDILFTVEAALMLPTPIRIPYFDPIRLTLTEQHSSFVECPHEWRDNSPPEGHIY